MIKKHHGKYDHDKNKGIKLKEIAYSNIPLISIAGSEYGNSFFNNVILPLSCIFTLWSPEFRARCRPYVPYLITRQFLISDRREAGREEEAEREREGGRGREGGRKRQRERGI